jgi:RNA polymerase sigma factor (sigma-70 family)
VRSDTELVAAAAGGDAGAFGEIVTRYRSLVCAITYSGTGDFGLSEEVAQETFVSAWKGLAGLREPGKLKAWIAGIARNLVKSAHRARARASAEPLEAAAGSAAPDPSPLAQALANEQQALVWRALAEIPETYREPLVLFYREEQSIERVAEALDLSVDAVKQRLSRGRVMLRDQVASAVESALARTRPGHAFTLAVVAAVLPGAAPPAAAATVAAAAAEGSVAAKGAAAAGLAGAVAGPLLGVAGAYIGARASIENTRSPRERRFMVRFTWIAVALSLAFVAVELAGLLLFPRLFAHLTVQLGLCGVYSAVLVAFILRGNRRQRQIQVEDGTYVDPRTAPVADLSQTTPRVIYASFAGGVFGSLCWMPIMAFIARDYALGLATIAFGLVLYTLSVRAALRRPQAFFRISMAELAAIAVWTVAVVNWRWDAWMVAYRQTWVYEPMSDLPLWAINLLLAGLFLWMFARLFLLDRRHRTAGPLPPPGRRE